MGDRIQRSINPTQSTDPHVAEIQQKVADLVDQRFGGDWKQAFDSYAGQNGEIDRNRLGSLLSDANVGSWLTRGAWVSGVMDRFDTDSSGGISWQEFQDGTGRR
jgi:hypothetical protein